jgi:hypothetical protein
MHPDILRELGSQRNNEMRARAHRIKLARMARREQRAGRRAEQIAQVVVPDFVDGSFLASAGEAAERKPRRILVGRHAA